MNHWLTGALIGFVVGGVLSYGVLATIQNSQPHTELVRQGGYEYINPLISCDFYEEEAYKGFDSLQNALLSEAQKLRADSSVSRIAIYFRDLDNGYWTGVSETSTFIPASLGKVPLLISVLKQEQTETALDNSRLTFTAPSADSYPPYYPPSVPLTAGTSYTVHDLLTAMIARSDNNAADLLTTVASISVLADVYSNFGVPPPDDPNANSISPKQYMRFFRILYNASYLGRVRSQTALKILGTSEFADGLVAGLPARTPVSHKFGERTVNSSLGVVTNQLHDCGIVYYPGHPYGICVMTEGNDMASLAHAIADISKVAYASVSNGLLIAISRNEAY